MTFKAT